MKFKTYFVLRGDNEHLARGELKALLEITTGSFEVKCYPMLCLSTATTEEAVEVVKRSGYVKEAGVLLRVFDLYSPSDAREVGELLGGVAHVSVYKSPASDEAIRAFLERAGVRIGVKGVGEKRLLITTGTAVAGIKVAVQNTKEMLERSRTRPFKRSIALTPDIARALVNLSRARRGSVLVDPFAGTGAVLVEAWSMGIRGVAVELDYELAKGMKLNFEFFAANAIPIIGDSRYVVFREVDHVATDLPYGRGASTHGIELKLLYRDFLERLSEYLSKKGFACFMTPLWMEDYVDELVDQAGLRLIERYYDYVHSSLTRVISVVVKK